MASIAQSPDSDFELTLANLSHAQLRDKAPSLMDYMLGFEIVDANDDQTHALGVFGFKVGEQLILVPCFYLNGELKCNFMYLKEQDLFLPLADNWISFLLNRRPFKLGEKEPRTEQQLGVMSPDIRGITGRAGRPGLELFNVRSASDLGELPKVFTTRNGSALQLPEFLEKTANCGTVVMMLDAMKKDERFNAAVTNYYSLDKLITKRALDNSKKFNPNTAAEKDFNVFKAARAIDRSTNTVKVIFGKEAAADAIFDKDREALMRGEIIVRDNRSEHNGIYKRGSYNLVNPTISGKYELLTDKNTFVNVWVFIAPHPIGEGVSRAALVVNLDKDNEFFYQWPTLLWCKPMEGDRAENLEAMDKLDDVTSMTTGNNYVIATNRMAATVAFKVENKLTDKDGTTRVIVCPMTAEPSVANPLRTFEQNHEGRGWVESDNSKAFARNPASDYTKYTGTRGINGMHVSSPLPESSDSSYPTVGNWNVTQIVIVDRDIAIKCVGNTLFVPNSAKVIKLAKSANKDNVNTWSSIDPGSLISFEMGLMKSGMSVVKVSRDYSNSYFVNGTGPFSRQRVVLAAIKKSGASAKDADSLVDIAPGKSAEYLMKLSADYAPPIPEPGMGFDSYAGVPEQYEMNALMQSPQMDANPEAYLGKAEKEQMMQAAQTGQKEVFDTSAIASLIKTIDNDDLIGKYLGDLILGLDRVNRIMCIYYWFGDKFKERYGNENLPELEDQLKNVSSALGDLILFLKQRRISSGSSLDGLELNLGARV